MQAAGYIYAFTTPSMPGIFKIGATDRDPEDRLAEANASHTWCPPEPYVVAYTAAVGGAFATERAVHALLAARRVSPRREFFRISDDEARALFALVALVAHPATLQAPATDASVASSGPDAEVRSVTHARSPVAQLRTWVDAHYTRIPLRAKDTGTKLMAVYAAYNAASPRVHAKMLGKTTLGRMLSAIYPGIGPHDDTTGNVSGLYLLR
jgi:hypothetical protein